MRPHTSVPIVDATAGLLAGFPVAAQSAVLPRPPKSGEQVTDDEKNPKCVCQALGTHFGGSPRRVGKSKGGRQEKGRTPRG